jgi:hypothetical protein
MPPSGNDPETVAAIYQHLFAQYMERLPGDRTEILWSGPIYVAIYAVALIGFFFALSSWMRPRTGHRPALPIITSFAGQLTEKVGGLRRFDWLAWLTVTIWGAYFAVKAMIQGVVY